MSVIVVCGVFVGDGVGDKAGGAGSGDEDNCGVLLTDGVTAGVNIGIGVAVGTIDVMEDGVGVE